MAVKLPPRQLAYDLAAVKTAPYSLRIKDLNGWLKGPKPNHGLLPGSRWEPFDPFQWANFQQIYWYKVTLVMEFAQEL